MKDKGAGNKFKLKSKVNVVVKPKIGAGVESTKIHKG